MYKLLSVFLAVFLFSACKKTVSEEASSAPTTLVASLGSPTQVNLSWTDNSTNEKGFTVQRKTGSGAFADLVTLGKDIRTYIDRATSLGTTYTYRVYAFNNAEVPSGYSNEATVTTRRIPELTTTAVYAITSNSAQSGGNITNEWGSPITANGIIWSTSPNPTISLVTKTNEGGGSGLFLSSMTGLLPNTIYYVKAYATNGVGTNYGNQLTFTTLGNLPTLSTRTISNITTTGASSGGTITDDGGSTITQRGICWGTSTFPTTSNFVAVSGSGTGTFTANLTNLQGGTTYYVRAYATNSTGTGYGDQQSFTTSPSAPVNPGSVTDISGNTYPTILVGNQVWMAENLRTTKYSDGSNINVVSSTVQWNNNYTNSSNLPMMCWYNNDQATNTANKFGALYNWFAVNSSTNGNRNICPTGWRVPTDADWNTLISVLDPAYLPAAEGVQSATAGGKMKSTGTQFWASPNTDATNSVGFSGLPCGYRDEEARFFLTGLSGLWWSSTQRSISFAWYRGISNNTSDIGRNSNTKVVGFSVRCVRN